MELGVHYVWALVATIVSGLGASVVLAGTKRKGVHLAFAAFLASSAMLNAGSLLFFNAVTFHLAEIGARILILGILLSAAANYDFVVRFFTYYSTAYRHSPRVHRFFQIVAVIGAAVSAICLAFGIFPVTLDIGEHTLFVISGTGWPEGGIVPAILLLACLYIGLSLDRMWRTRRRETNVYLRNRLDYLLAGNLVYFVGILSDGLLALGLHTFPIAAVTTLFQVVIVAMALIRHQLMDFQWVLSRSLVYTAIAGVVAGLYISGAALILVVWGDFWLKQFVMISLFLAFLVAYIHQPLRESLESILERLVFYGKSSPQKRLAEVLPRFSACLDEQRLENLLLESLNDLFTTRESALILFTSEEVSTYQVRCMNLDPAALKESAWSPGEFNHEKNPFSRIEAKPGCSEKENRLAALQVSAVLRLSFRGQGRGFLLLGRKRGRLMYHDEDERLITVVANHWAMCYENACLYRKELELVDSLRLAERIREEFFTTINHEIRSPISAILINAHILKEQKLGPLPHPYSEFVTELFQTIKGVATLINDLFDLSKIRLGQLPIVRKQQELTPLIEETLRMIKPLAEGKDIHLTTSGNHTEDTLITADPIRLEQILLNLLNNAVRFTPNGGAVSVDVAVGTRDIGFSVSDTGPGIPVEEQDLIFEPFVRGKKVRERHEGSGLGLAVAKHLVQLHGGSITVESYPGHGTTFTVHLPQSRPREVLIPLRKPEGNRDRTLSAAS